MNSTPRIRLNVLATLTAVLLAGCATHKPEAGYSEAASDPWEPTNRTLYAFNTAVDKATLRPLALGYRKITPQFFRTGVSNLFDNLGYPTVFVNDFLQGKFRQGGRDFLRFGVNSTLGLAGLFDVASKMGLSENSEDFGQTLAVWGVPAGPYLQLPLLGPSSLRDAPSMVADYFTNGLTYVDNTSVRDKLQVARLIDLRYRLLTAETLLDDSYDPYLTLRESWLQRRAYQIYDGDPPLDDEFFDDEFFDDELDEGAKSE